jgi:hypothetical protein
MVESTSGYEWLMSQEPSLEQHLYHYTSVDALQRILDGSSIRLGSLAKTNDPCEYNEWIADLFFSSGHEGPPDAPSDEVEQAMEDIDRLLRRNVCVGCFTLDREPRREAGAEDLFHLGWARARMWDQYAQKNTGACLVFDQSTLVGCVEDACAIEGSDFERMQGRVNYFDQRRVLGVALDAIRRDGVNEVIERLRSAQFNPTGLYYRKNHDWASEEEYRITVVRSNPAEDQLDRPLMVPFQDSLEAIVVGEHFPSTEMNVIRHRQAANGIPIFQCLWIDGAPHLEIL